MIKSLTVSALCVLVLACAADCVAGETKLNIEMKDVKKQSTLVIKKTVKQSEIGATLGEILGKVFTYIQNKKITPLLPMPITRYTNSAKDTLDIEGGVVVPEGSKGEGDIVASELPAGKAAFAVHTGPYDKLHDTWEAMKTQLAAKGLKTGTGWEVYITDPGNTKPEELKTEIYILVEEKK